MSIASLIVLIVVAGSATTDSGAGDTSQGLPPVHRLEPVSSNEFSECRQVSMPGEAAEDPVATAIELLEASRARDERCGAPDAAVAVCRGLWAAWVLDPVVVASTRPQHAGRAGDIAGWAIESAASRSAADDEPLAEALRELGRINQQLTDAELSDVELSDAELHALLERRAGSEIIDPLTVAERRCNAPEYRP